MKLSEIVDLPLSEVLKQMELKRFNITSNDGVVECIELKYTPKDVDEEPVAGDNRSDLFKRQGRR